MVRYTWIVFVAVVGGTATAYVLGGGSRWGTALTLATLAVAIAATVTARLRRHPVESPIDKARVERQRAEWEQFDESLLQRVRDLVSARDIDWLRQEDFRSVWRDSLLSSLRNVSRADELMAAESVGEVGAAVARFVAAADGFIDYYERHTRPDLLMAGTEWREIDPRTSAPEPVAAQSESWSTVRDALMQRAAEVLLAYDMVLRKSPPPAEHTGARRPS